MKIKKVLLVAVATVIGFASSAHATLLGGKTVYYQYHYPSITSGYSTAAYGNYVVGSGVEVSNIADNVGTLNFSDTNLYVDFTRSTSSTPADFNGFEIFDVLGGIDSFTSVSINAATNMAGFNASRITFDANHIWVNFQGLGFNANTVVSLDINAGSNVPEPGSIALLGLGLFGVAASRRKSAK